MKLIRRRDYKTKKRLGFEGLYLKESGFDEDTPIDCNINKSNGSIMIKIVNNSRKCSYKVTRNVTRSGKTVPAICIKNKTIEKFIESFDDLEIIIFKGIIILAAKNKNKNIIISQALIAHNKSLRENIKSVVSSLIRLGIINDDIMFEELRDLDFNDEHDYNYKFKRIPKKVLSNLKKSFKFNINNCSKNINKCINSSSNAFVLSCIVDDSKEYKDKEEEEENEESIVQSLIIGNYKSIYKSYLTYKSYERQRNYLYKSYFIDNKIVYTNDRFIDRINSCLDFKKRIDYFDVQILFVLLQIGYIFLEIRKQINTLSPPKSLITCLKCLV